MQYQLIPPSDQDVGLEGFGSIIDFIVDLFDFDKNKVDKQYDLQSYLKKVKSVRINKDIVNLMAISHDAKPYYDIPVSVPSQFYGYVWDYARDLKEILEQYQTIEKRLYDPLIEYFSSYISNPSSAYFPPRLSLLPVEKHQETLSEYFRGSSRYRQAAPRSSTHLNFGVAYKHPKDFAESIATCDRIIKAIEHIDRKSIIKKENRLVELSIQANKENALDNIKDKEKQHIVSQIRAVSMETRALGSLIYQTDVLRNMLEKTQIELEEALEEAKKN